MRPVNLIPAEERRGEQSPLRSGPLAYILLGALVAVLAGVAALVLTENQISASKAEIVELRREDAAAQAKAERLAAYTRFQAMSEQRVATVASLADSRFDWERVMRELALILPSDVWLVKMSASASPSSDVEAGGASTLRGAVPGPALELSGCARGQDGVAGFVTALEDIDGVTRVGVQSSALPDEKSGAGDSSGSTDDCRTREFIAKFEIVAAFDAAPIPITAESEGETVSATETAETASSETEESPAGEEAEGE